MKGTNHSLPGISTQLIAIMGALLPMVALSAWMHGFRETGPGVSEFFLGPLLVGGGMVFWLLFLQSITCRAPLSELGIGHGRPWQGLALGILMGGFFLGLKFLTDPWLMGLFPRRPPNPEIFQLIRSVANDLWLLALWLGPVVWIGIAGFEELWRAFMITRIEQLVGKAHGRWIAVVIVSLLVAAAHAYQGPAAVLSIGFKSLLFGAYFVTYRRLWPLIVTHAVYDSVQIVLAVIAINQSTG